MSRARQRQQSDEMRGRILGIARRIMSEEGPEALSIRRITKEMDYSAAIVYHYFESKEEILHCLLMDGYKKILASIRPSKAVLPPDEALRASMRSFIMGVLEWPSEYLAAMLSKKPEVLAVTSVLDADVCEKREAFRRLAAAIEDGISGDIFAPCDPVITAQALWCALFGLAARLIIENAPPDERRQRLIDRQIDILMKGLYA